MTRAPQLTKVRLNSLFALAVLGGSCLLSGCVTSRVEQFKQTATGVDDGDTIVILARQHHSNIETEANYVQCLEKELQGRDVKLKVEPSQKFRDGLYPWFEPGFAPMSTKDLPELFARPGVADQIAATGVRYLVWLDGDTERVDGGGGVSCAAGPGGAGCFGLAWWETDSKYEASVWDLKDSEDAGTLNADVSGHSVMPALWIPIPLIARTQHTACNGLADQLYEFLTVKGGIAK